jgi:uncharacterized protein YndB with AHSA1/START domain
MTDPAPTTDTAEDLGPVSTQVRVAASPEKAFRVFTEGFDRWWPRSHHIGEGDLVEAIVEPFVGGRWYEKNTSGNDCVWGEVLAWDPPNGVSLSWAIDGEFHADPHHASRIDVTFTLDGDGTVVLVEHSEFAGHKAAAELHGAVMDEGGWPSLLEAYNGELSTDAA